MRLLLATLERATRRKGRTARTRPQSVRIDRRKRWAVPFFWPKSSPVWSWTNTAAGSPTPRSRAGLVKNRLCLLRRRRQVKGWRLLAASDEACGTVAREVVPRPLHQHQQAILELDQEQ